MVRMLLFLQRLACLLVFVLFCSSVFSQTKSVSGIVREQSGDPIEGVTVNVEGRANTSLTDKKGVYRILAKVGEVLEFSHINYSSEQVTIKESNSYNVTLNPRSDTMSDVVVIGYGSVDRKDMTGSVSSVNVEEMAKAPVMSFEQALAGRVAGVQATTGDGQPGSGNFSIVVRGAGSLTQNTSPLYVVDGVQLEDFDPSSLNMDDIQQFNVLKDASATAIYGARGANGVIVIETKKGKTGKPNISYASQVGFQNAFRRMEMMSPYEFVRYQLERNNYSTSIMARYTPKDFSATDTVNYRPNGNSLDDYKSIKGINWQDLIFQKGITQIHNLSLTGGSEQTKYLISGSYFDMQGVLINTGSSRATARFSLDQTINKKLKAGLSGNYSSVKSFGNNAATNTGTAGHAYGYVMFSAWAFRPVTGRENLQQDIDEELIDEDFDPDAGTPSTSSFINPRQILENENRVDVRNQLNANAYANYQILKDLHFRTTVTYQLNTGQGHNFYNEKTTRGNPAVSARGIQGSMAFSNNTNWQTSSTLTYNKAFKKIHKVNAMAGIDFMESINRSYGFGTQLIPFDDLGHVGIDDGIPVSTNVTVANERLNSVFGRLNYEYKSKYYFTTTHRLDGSSKFAPKNRWAYFPSVALMWRLKNEKFLKSFSKLSDLRLRFGYGVTGNNRVSQYANVSSINYSINDSYSFGDALPIIGFPPVALGNNDLRWESSHQASIGVDVSLLDSRVELTVDAYRKNTKDLLLNANIPWHLGFERTYKNIGDIQNEGLEFTLNTHNIKGNDFNWRSSFNISFNENKILALTNDQQRMLSRVTWDAYYNNSFLYVAEVGKPAAMFMGYVFDGVYQYSDFDLVGTQYVLKPHLPDNGGSTRASTQPGSIKYKDINGDGTINQYDETIIGNPMPKHLGGFSNDFTYKGFNLNVFFQWSYGNDVFNANRTYFEGGRPANNRNQFATYVNRWSPENPSNQYFKAGGQGPPGVYSSMYIEDASFLRLKTVALSYSLPSQWVKKFARSINLTAAAQNLITWTKYQGPDPEVSIRHTILTPGFDFSPYPRARVLVFGIKANF